MRIRTLEIERWRNLRDLRVSLDPDADFICLVGENGVGKSNLLEVIAYSAAHFGLTAELNPKRPFPFQRETPFKVAVVLDLEGMIPVESFVSDGFPAPMAAEWDGTLIFYGEGGSVDAAHPVPPQDLPYRFANSSPSYYTRGTTVAGGISDVNHAYDLASRLVGAIQQLEHVLHLYIDAERVFPDLGISDAEVLERARQDPREPTIMRQQAAIATQNLYLEWMRSLLGEQQRMQTAFWEAANKAVQEGVDQPTPEDPFSQYRSDLGELLPHLAFVRLDPASKRLIFDSAGESLPYEDLSGGERELAFLVGQMDRFGVEDGLFLLDEPELHLNAELLQRWLAFLRSSTATGQVWIATHSLEAVEAAGEEATLVLERDPDRSVRRAQPLGKRPALRTLAPLLGTPAFSLAGSTFVLIEGERPGRERERFVQVSGALPAIRFLEAGSCVEVAKKFQGLRLLASEAEQLRVGAFIDRDHRSPEQASRWQEEQGVNVLPVHEIENYFLHPDLVNALLSQAGDSRDGFELLRDAADKLAGQWIWERAVTRGEWDDPPGQSIARARQLQWEDFARDRAGVTTQLLSPFASNADSQTLAQRRGFLATAISGYETLRADRESLWKEVAGKEALRDVSATLGFSEPEALESRAARLWREAVVARPAEAEQLLSAIQGFQLHG